VIYLDFWNDGNGIYDRLAAELVRRHGSALGARLAADGRLKFGIGREIAAFAGIDNVPDHQF
ncbi:hypothetical protein ONJ87_25495, partial [Salmonella enterica subsp. enterica serovar Anatum]|nr:hypothetical protein [Salmonella enterica subsp. enterica serovar Anatum]